MILGVLDSLLDRPAKQKYLLLGVAMVGVVYLYSFVVAGQQDRLGDLSAEVERLDQEFEQKRQKTDARAEFERELRELSAQVKHAEARLPDQREIASLLSNVAASGRSAGLEIVLFRQKPEVYHDFHADVPVQMQMRGTYHDLVSFLDRVKRLDRIVNVSDIQLTKPRLEGERMVLEAACTATTFRFLDEAERQRIQREKKDAAKKPAGAGKGA